MNEQLLEDTEVLRPQVVNKTTLVFDKSLDYFKQAQTMLMVYSAAKFFIASILVILKNSLDSCKGSSSTTAIGWGKDQIEPWMILIIVHGFSAFIYYLALLKFVSKDDQKLLVAESLGHLIMIEVRYDLVNQDDIDTYVGEEFEIQNAQFMERFDLDRPLEESRKVSIMANEIKKKVQKFSWIGKYVGKACFILFQCLEMWGLIFYFTNYDNQSTACDDIYAKFLFVILFLGMYQYLDIYIMFVLIVVFMPLLVCYQSYEWLKVYFRRRRERRRINTILSENPYSDGLTIGSNECTICQQFYAKGEQIIVLPCSDKHHFHSECIRSWFNVNSKCPLCRINIMDAQENL